MNQDPLDLFVENLIKSANLELPDDFRGQFAEKLKEQVNRRLGLALLENLDEAGVEQYNRLMDAEPAPDYGAIQAFYQQRIPDLEERLQAELSAFSQDFLAASK